MTCTLEFREEFDPPKAQLVTEKATSSCWGRLFHKKKKKDEPSWEPICRSRAMSNICVAHNPVFQNKRLSQAFERDV